MKVTIVERENVGGVCLNVGCIPSKALITAGHNFQHAKGASDMGITSENATVDFSKVQSWKQSVVNKLTGGVSGLLKGNKVETVVGEAYFQSEDTVRIINEDSSTPYKFKKCIIATGSTPIELPAFKWSKRVLSSTGALNLPEIPKNSSSSVADTSGWSLVQRMRTSIQKSSFLKEQRHPFWFRACYDASR